MTNQTTVKSYARTIDMRTAITAHPILGGAHYEVEGVDAAGKRKFTAVFFSDDEAVKAAAKAVGYEVRAPSAATEDKVEAKTLNEKAMLVQLRIKGWSGRKLDDEATNFTLQSHQAQEGMGRFTKLLVERDVLKPIKKCENEARKVHKELTLPWNENGQRILPAKAFNEYQKQMASIKRDWEAAVQTLLNAYEDHIETSRGLLGGLFKPEDYPEQHELEDLYDFDPELAPLPVDDFRVKMSDAEMDRIKGDVQRRNEARLNAAMGDVYHRLHSVVAHMAERLRAYKVETIEVQAKDRNGKPVFEDDGKPRMVEKVTRTNPLHDSILTNTKELCDMMPLLNLTNDPELDAMVEAVKAQLLAVDGTTLRDDEAARKDVADKAEEITGLMAAMM